MVAFPCPQPLVVACGMGVNSVAMLVGFYRRGIRPDLILFADTGGERPETYAYIKTLRAWLKKVGFPDLIVVRYKPRTATYKTLEAQCLATGMMPALAYGGKSCSIKYKRVPQDKFVRTWDVAKRYWKSGKRLMKAIGYDAGPADSRRIKDVELCPNKKCPGVDGKRVSFTPAPEAGLKVPCPVCGKEFKVEYEYWYPLREWGWDRVECVRQIEAEGLPVPIKSCCFFCPAMRKNEIDWQSKAHPELVERAIAIEKNAREKGFKGSTVGLGRSFSWTVHTNERKFQLSMMDDEEPVDCGGGYETADDICYSESMDDYELEALTA